MELRHLRYFVSVAELGSFTRAAQALCVAQPALSSQIRDLEAELGAQLLVRHPRGVTLTDAGTRLLRDARDFLVQAERLKQNASCPAGVTERPLNIGFIASASSYLLPKVLGEFRLLKPNLTINMREMLSTEQLAALQTGHLDVAICRPPVNAKSLWTVADFFDPLCLAIPMNHPLGIFPECHLEQAANADFVSFKRDQPRAFFDQTLKLAAEAGFTPKVCCEAGTVFGVLDMVRASMGVAIVPSSCAGWAPEGIVFRRLIRPMRPGAILMVTRRNDREPSIEVFGDLVKKSFLSLQALVQERLSIHSRS